MHRSWGHGNSLPANSSTQQSQQGWQPTNLASVHHHFGAGISLCVRAGTYACTIFCTLLHSGFGCQTSTPPRSATLFMALHSISQKARGFCRKAHWMGKHVWHQHILVLRDSLVPPQSVSHSMAAYFAKAPQGVGSVSNIDISPFCKLDCAPHIMSATG